MEEDFGMGFVIGVCVTVLVVFIIVSFALPASAKAECAELEDKFNVPTMYSEEMDTCLISQNGVWTPEQFYTFKP